MSTFLWQRGMVFIIHAWWLALIRPLYPLFRLAIHLQHLTNTPTILENKIDDSMQLWRGSDDIDNEGYFEAIHRKKFSYVCTAPVKYDPRWSTRKDVAYIVTGARLQKKNHNSKSVLHLRLLFSKVSCSFIVQSSWAQGSSGFSQKSGLFSAISTSITGNPVKEKPNPVVVDSSVFPSGPPVPVQTQKLLKFVDTSQLCRGPQDSPGHWLVTGARLDLDKGKISLQVKFSLLNINSWKTFKVQTRSQDKLPSVKFLFRTQTELLNIVLAILQQYVHRTVALH